MSASPLNRCPARPLAARVPHAAGRRRWIALAMAWLAAALLAGAPPVRAADAPAASGGLGTPLRNAAAEAPTGLPPVASAAAAMVPAGAAGALPAQDYRISRSDELNLRFYFTPELNTTAIVRSDGRISLPLLGELHVEGLTVTEMAGLVERLLAPQVRRPQVSINVQSAATQRVFVGGEVGKPGMQPLVGPLTVVQAVMVAEGLRDTAQPSEVLVLRRGLSGQREVLRVNLEAVMSGRDPAADMPLNAFDVVVVPRSGIADVGRWVDLYIRRVLPISFGFSYTVNSNEVSR